MAQIKPLVGQQELEIAFTVRANALQKLRTGNAHAKHLLRALELRIGNGRVKGVFRGYKWSASPEELADECELSRASTFRALSLLENEGYITRQGHQGKTPTFVINWNRILCEVDSYIDQAEGDSPQDDEQREVSNGDFEVSQRDYEVSNRDNEVSQGDFEVSQRDFLYSNPYLPVTNPSSSPSSQPEEEDEDEGSKASQDESPEMIPAPTPTRYQLLTALRALGINQASKAINDAQANGTSLAKIQAVIDHVRRFPGRWPPEVIFSRLTNADAQHMAAGEGWFGDSPEWAARQRQNAQETKPPPLEAEFGPELDRLPVEQLRALAEELGPRDQPYVLGMLGKDQPSLTTAARELLCRQLALRRARRNAAAVGSLN